jgi:hypothetical protein
MPRLFVLSGPDVGSALAFEGTVVLGREKGVDLVLHAPSVSRKHARLENRAGRWFVVDLGSSNGTQVNGAKVARQRLGAGDVIAIGGTELCVEDLGGPSDTLHGDGLPPTEALGAGRGDLKAFARIARALASETELQPLLRRIVDSAVALVGGERGFLLLAERPAGHSSATAEAMTVRIARQFDGADIPVPSSRLSMGIAERAKTTLRSRDSFCTRSMKACRVMVSSCPWPLRRGDTVPASASRGPTTSM